MLSAKLVVSMINIENIEFPFKIQDFLVVIFLIIILLTILKIVSIKKYRDENHSFSNGIRAGNTQLIGQKDEQNDYFSIIPTDNSLFAIISDGVTNKRVGKFAAIISVEILKANFVNQLHEAKGIKNFFQVSFQCINKRLNDNIYGNKVGATLISAIIKNNCLHFASVGNCVLFLFRNGEIISVNDMDSSEIEIGKISLIKNDIAMLCSHGAYESLTEMEIARELSNHVHPYEKCMNFAKQIQRKRKNYQDNATIIILENMVQ